MCRGLWALGRTPTHQRPLPAAASWGGAPPALSHTPYSRPAPYQQGSEKQMVSSPQSGWSPPPWDDERPEWSPPAQASGCSTGWFGKMFVGQKQVVLRPHSWGDAARSSLQSRHPPLPYKTRSWRPAPAGKRRTDPQPGSNILNQVYSQASLRLSW